MLTKCKQLWMLIVVGMALSVPLMVASPAYALFEGARNSACDGVGGCDAAADNQVEVTLGNVINVLSVIGGIIAVIMIIIAGFKYIVSSGDTSSISSAKSTLIYAIVGVIVIALAQFIVRFVIERT